MTDSTLQEIEKLRASLRAAYQMIAILAKAGIDGDHSNVSLHLSLAQNYILDPEVRETWDKNKP
jgi:hypothetical protein